jgi:GrpB-like predicted nucleotidyltransferase (UPF0157 family)
MSASYNRADARCRRQARSSQGCARREIAEFRAFHDRLRADPELLAAYVARKREVLPGGTDDSIDYSIARGSFVRQAMGQGERA